MKIAVVGHIRHLIAAPFMGGMESHCHELVRGLEKRGHDVTLFAAAGSRASNLHVICETPYEAVLPWDRWRGTERLNLFQNRAFLNASTAIEAGGFDVVHNNSLSPAVIEWSLASGIPCVTSQHVPPFAAMRAAVAAAKDARTSRFTVTSHHQRGLWGEDAGENMHVVPNGIALDRWQPVAARENYLVWFGRITQNKGLREAVAAARKARVRLRIVGMIEDRAYFDRHAGGGPGGLVTYEGHLSGEKLLRIVARARAAVVTPMWDEPFGLVAAEAMAAGVPVIAFDRGAMREVLGDCGRLVEPGNIDALATAMSEAHSLDGVSCRRRIADHFSIERMIAGYERIYRMAMEGCDTPASGAAADVRREAASSCSSTSALLA